MFSYILNFLIKTICYSGVEMCVGNPYSIKWMLSFSISIITTHLWESNYTEYQEHLFNKINGFKEYFLTQ